jgi:hypothetical protein
MNKRVLIIVSIVASLLLVPLIAMQFTDEVNWNFLDFMIAALLLLVSSLIGDFIIRKVTNSMLQIPLYIAVLVLLLLIWVELAVGIF